MPDPIPAGAEPVWQDIRLALTPGDWRAQVTLRGGCEVRVPLASPDPTGDRLAFAAAFERSLRLGITFGPRWRRWLWEA